MGQFNISNLETLRAIVQAVKNLKSPVFIGTSEGESKFLGLKQAVALVRTFCQETDLPIFLNLDHGKSFEYIEKAIEAGYGAVLFDGSQLPLKENIKITKKVVDFAKSKKVLVEGEVGVVGGDLTEPEEAKKFIKETKIDNLAINVGTFHGLSVSGEKIRINLQRLKEIKDRVKNIPLVLHGGSGVLEEDIKIAIQMGIVKININTELRVAYTNAVKAAFKKYPEETTPYRYLPEAITAVQKVVEEKIKLFKSNNKL